VKRAWLTELLEEIMRGSELSFVNRLPGDDHIEFEEEVSLNSIARLDSMRPDKDTEDSTSKTDSRERRRCLEDTNNHCVVGRRESATLKNQRIRWKLQYHGTLKAFEEQLRTSQLWQSISGYVSDSSRNMLYLKLVGRKRVSIFGASGLQDLMQDVKPWNFLGSLPAYVNKHKKENSSLRYTENPANNGMEGAPTQNEEENRRGEHREVIMTGGETLGELQQHLEGFRERKGAGSSLSDGTSEMWEESNSELSLFGNEKGTKHLKREQK